MPEPLYVARVRVHHRVHSQHLKGALSGDRPELRQPRSRQGGRVPPPFGGRTAFGSYDEALADRGVDAVVIAVPPRFHLDLTSGACRRQARARREAGVPPRRGLHLDHRAARSGCVLPRRRERSLQATVRARLRRLLAEDAIGDMVFGHFMTVAPVENRRRLAQ